MCMAMKKGELIEIARKGVMDDENTLFISSFCNLINVRDWEFIMLFMAWMQNGGKYDFPFACTYINNIIQSNSSSIANNINPLNNSNMCFYGNLTYNNLNTLISKFNTIDIRDCYKERMGNYKLYRCKFPHEGLASCFGGDVGFPTKESGGTFFRYNLLFYWLTYKFKIWDDVDYKKGLIPCNDYIFEKAYKMGITKKKMKSSLKNTIELTRIAHSWFGSDDFYKMFELLQCFKIT